MEGGMWGPSGLGRCSVLGEKRLKEVVDLDELDVDVDVVQGEKGAALRLRCW